MLRRADMTMRRCLLVLTLSLIAAACYRDNASPFVHGAKNDPRAMGGTMVAEKSGQSAQGDSTNVLH
jgi:outer membrane PBP1 activator LpoA protein